MHDFLGPWSTEYQPVPSRSHLKSEHLTRLSTRWIHQQPSPITKPRLHAQSSNTTNKMQFKHTCTTLKSNRVKHGWRKIVLNFTPSEFVVNMGISIVSISLHDLPLYARWIHWISIAVFCLDFVLFITFTAISILRYLYLRSLAAFMINHPIQSFFTGTFSIGLSTIVNMMVFVYVPV